MSDTPVSRRALLARTAAAGALLAATAGPAPAARAADATNPRSRFTFCLNTSTIRDQKLPLPQVIDLAAKTGYTAMEPWINDLNAYARSGGDLKDLKKRFADNNIAVVDAIGFAPWLMGDEEANRKGVEAMKRDMDLVAAVGGLRIAAPPMGATQLANFDLRQAAERYRRILEVGEQTGVTPMLEFWGSSKSLSTLAEAAFIAAAAKHPNACILTDVYHLYRGGSDFDGLRLIAGSALPVMHFNDVPPTPAREQLKDEHRIYPGDGIAPIPALLQTLAKNGAQTALSLELFNKQYWSQPAEEVLKTGIAKMRATVDKAFA
jgi:sugar phosphate isomerase/epimerase